MHCFLVLEDTLNNMCLIVLSPFPKNINWVLLSSYPDLLSETCFVRQASGLSYPTYLLDG